LRTKYDYVILVHDERPNTHHNGGTHMVEDTHMAEAELTSATVRQDAAQQLTAGSKALFQP